MTTLAITLTQAQADALATSLGMNLAAPVGETIYCQMATFDGRIVRRVTAETFEISGSKNTCAAFDRLAKTVAATVVAAEVVKPATTEAPATERQIAYLERLIDRDPGAAMTVGASCDGANVVANLTKSDASRLIEQLAAGV
ncbi:hypothetical protein ACEYYA_01030 [Paracoccus sp. p3-h83]|uniref:hypothetical protein n=1 Tax=Paracoccus sp. p3-h83 TaxID=3342805 RepID=UPI0035BA070D